MDEAAQIYCKVTGSARSRSEPGYFSYNLFRLAGITQGIAGRVRDGTAAARCESDGVGQAHGEPLAQASWEYAQKAGPCRDSSCPGRGAAFFTMHRRAGTHFAAWGPRLCSAPRREGRRAALRPGHEI